jgi:S-methylmethionine-dependent homocysteine/selenocysteine methylase
MKDLLENHDLILIEAAIVERLRRAGNVRLHPSLEHAALIYDVRGRHELQRLYAGYISIARQAQLPLLLCTPTWRASYERVKESGVNPEINRDCVRFMQDVREAQGARAGTIRIGGFIGCKNDCYKPEEGLSASESQQFHEWQIDQLAQAGVDFLMAGTLPNTEEAIGITQAMLATKIPCIISYVIDRSGLILDGTCLLDAVNKIDLATRPGPLCYMVNCSYPTFLCAEKQPVGLFARLMGYQANSSYLDHSELDGSAQLKVADVADWGEEMLRLNREYGVKILGGCCGTGDEHLRYLAEAGRS